MLELESIWQAEDEDPELREQELAFQIKMQDEGRARIAELAERRRQQRIAAKAGAADSDDDDWDDVEVEYVGD